MRKIGNTGHKKPPGAGKSSFGLIDPGRVLDELGLKGGNTFLDMGCGRGDYAIAASKIIGVEGVIYGVDLWEEGIATLVERCSAEGVRNLKAIVADVGKRIPIEDETVDVCLMATVLHDLVRTQDDDGALAEARRLLKSKGSLVIIEYKKINGPPGPPVHIRPGPEEVETMVVPHGFGKGRVVEVGPYHYLITFDRRG